MSVLSVEVHSIDISIICIFTRPSVCTDIDECDTNTSTCEQLCSNTIGGFVCSCMDGYRLNITDNSTCDGNFNYHAILLC